MAGGVLFDVGDVALRFADEVDAVLAAAFGVAQGQVGLLEELLDGGAVAGEAGQAAADGQDAPAIGTEQVQVGVAELLLESFGQQDRLAGVLGRGGAPLALDVAGGAVGVVPEDHGELVAADAADDIVAAAAAPHQDRRLAQDLVAGQVAVDVVVVLEIVDVEDEQGDAALGLPGVVENLPGELPDVPAVLQAGQIVGRRQPLQVPDLLLQFEERHFRWRMADGGWRI